MSDITPERILASGVFTQPEIFGHRVPSNLLIKQGGFEDEMLACLIIVCLEMKGKVTKRKAVTALNEQFGVARSVATDLIDRAVVDAISFDEPDFEIAANEAIESYKQRYSRQLIEDALTKIDGGDVEGVVTTLVDSLIRGVGAGDQLKGGSFSEIQQQIDADIKHEKRPSLKTGLDWYDQVTNYCMAGVHLICAATGNGKSTFAQNIALNVITEKDENGDMQNPHQLFISTETTMHQYMCSMLARMAFVPFLSLMQLDEGEELKSKSRQEKLDVAREFYNTTNTYSYFGEPSVAELRRILLYYKAAGKPIRNVYIDWLEEIGWDGNESDDDMKRIKYNSKALSRLAIEMNICIFVCAQEKRDDDPTKKWNPSTGSVYGPSTTEKAGTSMIFLNIEGDKGYYEQMTIPEDEREFYDSSHVQQLNSKCVKARFGEWRGRFFESDMQGAYGIIQQAREDEDMQVI